MPGCHFRQRRVLIRRNDVYLSKILNHIGVMDAHFFTPAGRLVCITLFAATLSLLLYSHASWFEEGFRSFSINHTDSKSKLAVYANHRCRVPETAFETHRDLAEIVGESNAITVATVRDPSSKYLNIPLEEPASLQQTSAVDSQDIVDIFVCEDFVLLYLNTNGSRIDQGDFRSEVSCMFLSAAGSPLMSPALAWSVRGIWCSSPNKSDWSHLMGQNVTATVGAVKLSSSATFNGSGSGLAMVYESVDAGNGSTLVFAKGLPVKHEKEQTRKRIRCIYGNGVSGVAVRVAGSCGEGILCEPPPENGAVIAGSPLTLSLDNQTWPSVARVQSLPGIRFSANEKKMEISELREGALSGGPGSPHFQICMCTVIRDYARYLREWVMYHAHVGVEKVILYDNGSSDDIESVVDSLRAFNVSRYPWPWIKTQEAGFSHCATQARDVCTWMLFTDIDEFVFPSELVFGPHSHKKQKHAPIPATHGSPLQTLIKKAEGVVEKNGKFLGSIAIKCHNFGASWLDELPQSGQTPNYVCRMGKGHKYKSLVKLEALGGPRCNKIHRFYVAVERGYVDYTARIVEVVLKHYKFPVWKEYRQKFKRRVSTGVRDWNDEQGKGWSDKVEGLTTELDEPSDWKRRYCEMNDTDMQMYVRSVFRDSKTGLYPWER